MLRHKIVTLANMTSLGKQCAPGFYDETQHTFYTIQVPNASLDGIDYVTGKEADTVPAVEGNYWILTDEPVHHCLHAGKHVPARLPNGLWVVYNGVSSNLRSRLQQHLLRDDAHGGFGTQSGISLDLLMKAPVGNQSSHAKCVFAGEGTKKKTPKIGCAGGYAKPGSFDDVVKLPSWSDEERTYLGGAKTVYFKNGIHVNDAKHKPYRWLFYYAPVGVHSVRDYIEHAWREEYGVPVLCSYLSGR